MLRSMNLKQWLIVCFCWLTGGQALDAKEPIVQKIWTGPAPGVKQETVEREFTEGGTKRIAGEPIYLTTDISSPELVIYPATAARKSPAVMICPGGGHRLLAYDLEGTELAMWLNRLEITAIILKYRVPSTNQEFKCLPALQDAQRAMRVIRSNAERWEIDPERIGILGFSAGGEVAARLSLQFHQDHYDRQDAIDQLECKPDFSMLIYPAYLVRNDELLPELDPKSHPKIAAVPEFFLIHAWDDNVTPLSSLCLAKALKTAKKRCELHLFEKGGHGYGMRHVDGIPVTDWTSAAEPWLKEKIRQNK
jgi:acetyl esterase/lipase